jgi:ribonuclease HII
MKSKFLIGIDEAGRGPLAGPIAVGAVIFPPNFDLNLLRGIKDSKQLSEAKREEWFKKARKWNRISFHVSLVSAKTIDERGLAYAIKKAIKNCLRCGLRKYEHDIFVNERATNIHERDIRSNKLSGRLAAWAVAPRHCRILLDGSLKAPAEFVWQKTIIRGDETEPVISLAAIMAKVTRDRLMVRLAKKIPGYGFEIHKGYGTALHRKTIKKLGLSQIHRATFCH